MFQCFSWHNLRYIKNQQNFEVCNANIIVFLQGFMYVHNLWLPHARAHMCTVRCTIAHTHLKCILCMLFGKHANGSQIELFWLNCVDTKHKNTAQWPHHKDSWLTWVCANCSIWSTFAQTYLYFKCMLACLERQLVEVLFFWAKYPVSHRNVF